MVNGIFAADLALYIPLFPLVIYNFYTHRWAGFLAWYGLGIFCAIRIVAGAIGASNEQSVAANILTGIGTSPLILAIDGLVHEARTHRNPHQTTGKWLGWAVIYIITGLMAAAIALTVTGAMDIYRGTPKPHSIAHWKAGSALMVVAWVLEVAWAAFSLLPSQARRDALKFRQGTLLLYGTVVALVPLGVRVIYALVATATQRKDLSTVSGTVAVRVVLMFLPEALTAIVIVVFGFLTGGKGRNASAGDKEDCVVGGQNESMTALGRV
ncbi:uncharacterized protein DSM5745_02078 [Aspergillus mulundensis]|uniref:DUF7702 domain-containing protein n=1 Tax=Aspergillus mulundensis TaxID=1810919 RepID=A0A3D8SVF7_9EURO|nr:Uncharacterized protein DSM5745_02078 [Aspergillus mulundensis]RDW90303.1 Uncharacterized protein DSM5745_02078 [Aspergillus mulundensis]